MKHTDVLSSDRLFRIVKVTKIQNINFAFVIFQKRSECELSIEQLYRKFMFAYFDYKSMSCRKYFLSKGVSVYKPRVVFVSIHEIKRKTVTDIFKLE